MPGPLLASQVCHGAGKAPVGPVLLPLGWLPAVDRARARRVVLGLWASCGARGRFPARVCGAGGLFRLGAHRPRIRGAGHGSAPGR